MVKHGTTVKASVNDNNDITLITTDKMHLNLRALHRHWLVTQSSSPRGRGRLRDELKEGRFVLPFFPSCTSQIQTHTVYKIRSEREASPRKSVITQAVKPGFKFRLSFFFQVYTDFFFF